MEMCRLQFDKRRGWGTEWEKTEDIFYRLWLYATFIYGQKGGCVITLSTCLLFLHLKAKTTLPFSLYLPYSTEQEWVDYYSKTVPALYIWLKGSLSPKLLLPLSLILCIPLCIFVLLSGQTFTNICIYTCLCMSVHTRDTHLETGGPARLTNQVVGQWKHVSNWTPFFNVLEHWTIAKIYLFATGEKTAEAVWAYAVVDLYEKLAHLPFLHC